MSEYEDADLSEPCDNCGLPMINCECDENGDAAYEKDSIPMNELERLLEASIEYARMRKMLAEVVKENDILREELKLAELKLQRLARPRIVGVANVSN
jgi:hypothetical protein